jgi:hypothetical protein
MKLKINYLITILLLGLTVYLAWLYRAELNIASELNDNTFQFAMVAQMEKIFDLVVQGKLSFRYLFDNWNQIWGQGAPLAFYYNHLPQLLTVISHKIIRLAIPGLTLYRYFEILKYAFLVLTPIAFFLGAKLMDFSDLASLGTALIAGFISTYGSYGIDASSYLFVGFGLTSQLMAVFILPLAFGATYRALKELNRKTIMPAVVLNFLTFQSHVGTGTILLISEAFLIVSIGQRWLDLKITWARTKQIMVIFGLTLAAIAYFLIPMFLADSYRNYSHWEGLWKFNSFGWQKVVADFFNGQLFDYQRLPIVTGLVLLELFGVLIKRQKWAFLGLGFVFWLVMLFGRTTWGPLFDFLPGLKDFYLHRFVVGIHFFGIFLAGLAIESLAQSITNHIKYDRLLAVGLWFLAFILLQKPVVKYAQNNQRLIISANTDFAKDKADFEMILTDLTENNPEDKRIYAGTPGNWGRNFTVGQTPIYQRLSVEGRPVMTFYAHSWSLSSETEPFFDENRPDHYRLYNVGYLIAPDSYKPPEFAQKISARGKYRLYQIKDSSYFRLATAGPDFAAGKNQFINLVHLWQVSKWPSAAVYPTLFLTKPKQAQFRMTDLNNYLVSGSDQPRNLWETAVFAGEPATAPAASITGINNLGHQRFSATVSHQCTNCLLVFSMSYHPGWQVKIDNLKTDKLMVFPEFIGVKMPAGTHQVEFEYRPGNLKISLLVLGTLSTALF